MTDSAYAEWLQQPERSVIDEDTAQTSKWGALAHTWAASSCFAGEGAAAAEAARVLGFAKGPLVEERVTVAGRFDVAAVRGRVITITQAADPTYAAGADVFCLGGDCDHGSGITHFDVLRRL
jgi:hypothetical protein